MGFRKETINTVERDSKKVPYRNHLVCYDGNKQIGWRTEGEFKELSKKYTVEWCSVKTKKGMIPYKNNEPKISTS